jgi:hypothetical protein
MLADFVEDVRFLIIFDLVFERGVVLYQRMFRCSFQESIAFIQSVRCEVAVKNHIYTYSVFLENIAQKYAIFCHTQSYGKTLAGAPRQLKPAVNRQHDLRRGSSRSRQYPKRMC